MHVISQKALEAFWLKHTAIASPLDAWYRVVRKSDFETFMELKKAFNTADYVAPYTVFDVGGNNFRVITAIHYNRQTLYIREVFTHAEYDRWTKAYRSGKA
jgi:mRNA interferase HigB